MLHRVHEKGYTTVTDEKTGDTLDLSYVETTRHHFLSNRDYLYAELKKIPLPWSPLHSEGGYFLILDVSQMRPLIPAKFFETHDYEDPATGPAVGKYRFNMPDGRIPVDFAFCRWIAVEFGVVCMPISFFYPKGSQMI